MVTRDRISEEERRKRLPEVWERLKSQHPDEIGAIKDPWDENFMLTEEATNAYRKVTSRPAPVLPSGPQVPSQSDLPVQPAPPVPPSGEIPLSLFEKHLGRETPFRLRSELLKVPRAVGTEWQVGTTFLDPDEPGYLFKKGSWDRFKADRSQAESRADAELRQSLGREPTGIEKFIRANEIQAESLSPLQRVASEAIPFLAGEVALTKGKGFGPLAARLRGPGGGFVRAPGAKATVGRAVGTALEPLASTEELAGAGLGFAARTALRTGKKVLGVPTKPPTGFEPVIPTTPAVPDVAPATAATAREKVLAAVKQLDADPPVKGVEGVHGRLSSDGDRLVVNDPFEMWSDPTMRRVKEARFADVATRIADDKTGERWISAYGLDDKQVKWIKARQDLLDEIGPPVKGVGGVHGRLDGERLLVNDPFEMWSDPTMRRVVSKPLREVIDNISDSSTGERWISAYGLDEGQVRWLNKQGRKTVQAPTPDVAPTTTAARAADEVPTRGKLDSLFLPGESGAISVNEAFDRAKKQGLVKTKQDFQNLFRKELKEQLIDSGSGATGMKPTLKGLVPLELGSIGSVRRMPQVAPTTAATVHPFQALSNAQRGTPEALGTNRVPAVGIGIRQLISEHIGDIINRMTDNLEVGGVTWARDNVGKKAVKAIRAIDDPYGIRKEIDEQIKELAQEQGISFDVAKKQIDDHGKQYADAYRKLPTYNQAHKDAQEAAIAWGEQRYEDASAALKRIEVKTHDEETWKNYILKGYDEAVPTTAARVADDVLPTTGRAAGVPEAVTPPVTPITPTTAAVPEAGGAPIMADFPTDFDESVEIMVRPDNWRRFANLPGIRSIQGKFNPSAVANDPILQAEAGRHRLRTDANTLIQHTMGRLKKLGSQEDIFGKLDDKGLIAEGPLKGLAVNDIRTYPKKYASKTTPQIKEWIRVADEIEQAKLAYLKKNGIDISELTFDEGGQYAGRRLWGMTNELGEVENIAYVGAGPKRPGAKLAAEKLRIFSTAAEAIEKGYRYIPDDEALFINVQGAYNRVIDERSANWLLDGRIEWRSLVIPENLKVARESAKRQLKLANESVKALQRARRGETLPAGTVNAIERLFPQLEGRLREPTRVRVADVLKAAKKLDEPERVFEPPHPHQIRNAKRRVDEAERLHLLDPGNPQLLADFKKERKTWGWLKKRYSVFQETGEPLTVPHNVVKALRQDAIKDLDELLVAIRGRVVKRQGLKPAYEGGLIADIKRKTAQTLKMTKKARESFMRPTADEDIVPVPAFAGKAFPKATAESIRKSMKQAEFSKRLADLNRPASVSRFFMLGADLSPIFIHLLYLPGINPRIWAKGIDGFLRNMFNPKFLDTYLDLPENKAMLEKYPGLNLIGGGQSEFTEAIARGGALSPGMPLRRVGEAPLKTGALMAPRVLGKVLSPTVRPFARGFEGIMDVAAVEMAKSFDHLGTTAARREDLAQFINKFRGVTSSARLGVGTKTRQLESLATLAPNYNRAIAALLFDLFHGGLSGSLARRSLIQSTGAIALAGLGFSFARGESWEEALEHLDPRSRKFMTWKIANQNIGPGTKMRSVLKLIADSAENPERLKWHPWGDYEYMRNPIIRFGRGLSGPSISLGWDLLTGKDFIGDPTRDGVLQMTETVAKRFMYLWAHTILFEGGTPVDRLTRGTTEFLGGRAYPTSPSERREERGEEIREEIAGKLDVSGTYEDIKNIRGYGSGEAWADMDLTQIPETSQQQDPKTRLLMGRDPEYAELSQRGREDAKRRGGAWGDYYQEVDLLWDNDDKENLGVLQELELLRIASEKKNYEQPGKHYKLKRSDILTLYYHDKERALKRAKKRGAFSDDKDPEGPFAAAQDVYNRLLFADDSSEEYKTWVKGLLGSEYIPIEDELGFNWDERERRIEYLVRSYSQQFVDDMKALSEANPTRPLPQIELTYRKDIESITNTGYWNVDEVIARRYGLEDKLAVYNQLKRTNEPKAKAYLKDNEALRTSVINKVGDVRIIMRLNNPDLDAVLMKYGYVSVPAKPKNTGSWSHRMRNLGS